MGTLQLSAGFDFLTVEQKVLLLISIVCGIYFVLYTLPNEFNVFGHHWRRKRFANAARKVIITLFVLLFLAASVIHLVGVWVCSSHVLTVSSGCIQTRPARIREFIRREDATLQMLGEG